MDTDFRLEQSPARQRNGQRDGDPGTINNPIPIEWIRTERIQNYDEHQLVIEHKELGTITVQVWLSADGNFKAHIEAPHCKPRNHDLHLATDIDQAKRYAIKKMHNYIAELNELH